MQVRSLVLAYIALTAGACSNLLVSKGASADGSTILAYTADDMSLFGSLDLRPAADHPPGALREIWDWDGQYFCGRIPEVPHTLNVVGNVNELGVIITETTFGGRGDLAGQGTGAVMSYGDLIWTTLSRATSARDAIRVMDELTQNYGYESNGESYGVGDSDEVWLLEMVSKGKYGKGSVWVASRIPDGYVGSTANQARTEKFDHNDPENVLFSADVVSFAKQIGAYPQNGSDEDFSFREAYDPISFGGARFGEQRVWTMFNPVCGGCVDKHLSFAQGYNLSNSMPLFVPAVAKLSLMDVVHVMRDHAEGTWFDPSGLHRPDVGGESGHSPYRQRPLTWAFNNDTYLNERTVGIQQSGWAFIAQSRGWLPPPLRAVTWFAPDDAATSPRVPVYGGATRIPAAFGHRVGQTPGGGVPYAPTPVDGFTMNLDSAFWVWNLVGNVAFSERYSTAYPDIVAQVDAEQARMIDAAMAMEKDFAALWAVDAAAAVELMTRFGETNGMDMFQRWTQYWMFIFATYRDGGVLVPDTTGRVCGPGETANCTAKLQPGDHETGYTEDWRARIVNESPENAARYRVPTGALEGEQAQRKLEVMTRKRGRRVGRA